MSPRPSLFIAGLLAAFVAFAQPAAAPATPDAQPAAPLSSAAERVYDMAKPRILQVRTLLQAAGRQSTIGSGFLVTADGLAITNYHVVSQFALDPRTYRLEYLAPDGAIQGFLRAAGLTSIDEAKVQQDKKGDFYIAVIEKPGRPAIEVIGEIVPEVVKGFPWPKSMRWGKQSATPGALVSTRRRWASPDPAPPR